MSKEVLTISMGVTLFEDNSHKGPATQKPEDVNSFLAPFVSEIIKKHYPEAAGDQSSHWNYDTRFTVIRNFGVQNTQHLEFRDRNTGEIADQVRYSDICNAAKGAWKNAVMQAYPAYGHAALEEEMAHARFEYFPHSGLLVAFTLLKGLVQQGAEDFMADSERAAAQDLLQGTQRTLYLRFNTEKLSSGYGADSYRKLFTSVSPASLSGAILRMGDSAATLAGKENVNVIGITMAESERLEKIRQELAGSATFMASSDVRPFLLVEGMGEEPLVFDGIFSDSDVQVQDGKFSWAKSVWDELKKQGGITNPVAPPEHAAQGGSGLPTVEYGEVQAIPFPEGTKPLKPLGDSYYVVTNGKSIGKRFGVVDVDGRIVLPVTQKYSELLYGSIRYEMLSEKAISLEGWKVTVFSLSGSQIATYKKLVNLGSELLAVSNGDKFAIARVDGSRITDEEFDIVRPFADGVAIAQKGSSVIGYATDASVVFSLTDIVEIRPYCNGYAVFKQGNNWGAIDTKGNLALEAKWSWLRDAAYDSFIFSESVAPIVNLDVFGLVAAGGRIVLPCQYKNLEQIDANLLKHGTVIYYQYTEGNTRYTKSLLAFGIVDVQGNEVVSEGIASIGKESEGLRAYARYYSDNTVEFGYMDSNLKKVFAVASIGKVSFEDAFKFGVTETKSYIFGFDINDLLSPFSNGKAFIKLSWNGQFLKDGRWIDNTGKNTSPGQKPAPTNLSGITQTANTPDEMEAQRIYERLKDKSLYVYGGIYRKSCRRVAGDLWEIVSLADKISYVFSKMETTNGFSCGLIMVKDMSSRKWGYADHNGDLAVAPKYDEVSPFSNGRAWARLGKQYFIIQREAKISGNALLDRSYS